LKELIKLSGLTHSQIAESVGCHVTLVSQYVRRVKMPGFDKAIAMARVLNVPLKILALSLGLDVSGIPNDIETSDHDLGDPWDEE
jgi:transcriptional regulator with XRE-family HTH domain